MNIRSKGLNVNQFNQPGQDRQNQRGAPLQQQFNMFNPPNLNSEQPCRDNFRENRSQSEGPFTRIGSKKPMKRRESIEPQSPSEDSEPKEATPQKDSVQEKFTRYVNSGEKQAPPQPVIDHA